jgi:hypothetical protein
MLESIVGIGWAAATRDEVETIQVMTTVSGPQIEILRIQEGKNGK